MTTATTTRLHISPLTPDLLSTVLGLNLSKSAQNISYHGVQTFPENTYGFVELPLVDAEKLKKKLNGSILRGRKMKIEDARPSKRRHVETEVEDSAQTKPRSRQVQDKKDTKRDAQVIEGHELPAGRKVKRGWTESKEEKSKQRKTRDAKPTSIKQSASSKYTEKPELLFRTRIPENKKGLKKDEKARSKRLKGNTIHEFERTAAQPSFLRSGSMSQDNKVIKYVDGEGWVDENGNTVEAESQKGARKRKAAIEGLEKEVTRLEKKAKPGPSPPSASSSSSSEDSDSDSDPDNEDEDEDAHSSDSASKRPSQDRKAMATEDMLGDTTSSSGTSSDEEEPDSDIESGSETSSAKSGAESESEVGAEKDGIGSTRSSTRIKKSAEEAQSTAVHPLEALFKKPNKPTPSASQAQSNDALKPSLEIQTSFSFGLNEDADLGDGTEPVVPATPFTSQELRSRGIRSAAPTPDTAHPTRFNSYGSSSSAPDSDDHDHEDEDEDEDKDEETSDRGEGDAGKVAQNLDMLSQKGSQSRDAKKEPSEFEKWFWEQRGDNNRAWKARRRAVLKEKRQRENRLRRPKNW